MNVIISNKYGEELSKLPIDVIKSLNGEFEVNDLLQQLVNFFFSKLILDITAIKGYNDVKNIQKISLNLDADKIILLLDEADSVITSSGYLSQLVSMGIYNFTTNIEGVKTLLERPNTYKDVANLQNITFTTSDGQLVNNMGCRIIGVKNLAIHSGATTLIYMMKKELSKRVPTVAVEVDKKDFIYFNDKGMISTTAADFGKVLLSNSNNKVILVDVNDSNVEEACNDMIYLLEPSIIKLNKLLQKDYKIFEKMRGKKIVLNNCVLVSKDIDALQVEANTKFFYSIPPQDDRRIDNPVIVGLLVKLGILKFKNPEKKIKGIFKF